MFAKCPHCNHEFLIRDQFIFQNQVKKTDNKYWSQYDLDCPKCKSFIEFEAEYQFVYKSCTIHNANGSKTIQTTENNDTQW